MLSYNELKPGVIFILDGQPYAVTEYNFMRMQQRKPVAQTKIKNIITGKVSERTFHQNESFEEAEIDRSPLKYLYAHKNEYWFCEPGNPKNRTMLKEEILGGKAKFLKPNSEATALKFGEQIISIELPVKMSLKVIEAPPGIKGNTAQGGTKPVTLETGAKINVPLFVNEDDIIVVNTETGEYVGRE